MRRFYTADTKTVWEVITSPDRSEEWSNKIDVSEAQAIVDNGDGVIYNNREELDGAVAYMSQRSEAYPAVEDQLDQIFHGGLDAWKEGIQAIKDKHPKPAE